MGRGLQLVYGFAMLSIGLFWCVLAVFPWWIEVDMLTGGVVCCCLAVPFISVYTRFGLNSDGRPDPATEARSLQLREECLWWPAIWWIGLTPATVSLAVAVLSGFPTDGLVCGNPFYAFFGTFTILPGLWFLLVHPTAARLFDR